MAFERVEIGTATLYRGDCRDVLPALQSVDAVVSDPPYALVSSTRRVGTAGRGFMGQKWDTGEVAFDPAFWAEILRVLKPGGHVAAFSSTRTYHRLACAIEDAGFEIRDQLAWVYGSGFPKSHDVGDGWGTALKPAWEPIVLARKPLIGTVAANRAVYGVGAVNVEACRVEGPAWKRPASNAMGGVYGDFSNDKDRFNDKGRWPANLIHDGSDEVLAAFPAAPGQIAKAAEGVDRRKDQNVYGAMTRGSNGAEPRADSGSAARFFYCAKASKAERGEGNTHPTVKPVSLMRWLCRLITPAGGVVLDPFMGSGSTGLAAHAEGFRFIGIERDARYFDVARDRIETAQRQADLFIAPPSRPAIATQASMFEKEPA